jgi:pimeloyl-ACP methyl ester carboxylesterase
LEAGAGDESTTWQGIFQAVAQFTQVMTYDRAGLGHSDAAPRPRTAWQLTDDLQKLLRMAQLEGPYVLVGHSLGALISRLYAQRYPQDVAGLVLIDGPHPDQGSRFASSLAQIDPAHRFGALPLVVVASGKPHALDMPDLPHAAALAFDRAWDDMQQDLATLSTRGMHITAKHSGHYIHWDEPDLVVGAIHQIVRGIQNRSRES